MNTKVLGVKGEKLATEHLKKNGYKILETNYVNKIGEIDIICYNKKDDETVFVEVKTRSTTEFGLPCEAVNLTKQNKIKKTSELYLLKHNLLESKIRFDVIEILNDKINHIKYAF